MSTMMVKGRVLRGDEFVEHCKKHGLCIICGQVQTHKKSGFLLSQMMEPMTVTDANGKVTVYKGHHISNICFNSVEQVQIKLGERLPRRVTPPDGLPEAPLQRNSNSSHGRKPFQPDNVFNPHQLAEPIPEGSLGNLDHSYSYYNGPFEEYNNSLSSHNDSSNLNGHSTHRQRLNSGRSPSNGRHNNLSSSEGSDSRINNDLSFSPSNRTNQSSLSQDSGDIRLMGREFSDMQINPLTRSSTTIERESCTFTEGTVTSNSVLDGSDSQFPYLFMDSSSNRLSWDGNRSSDIGTNTSGTSNEELSIRNAIQRMEAQVTDGDYITFLNELDRRGAGGTDGADKIIVMEGLRLFRSYVVRDQLSRPNGVVIGGNGWVKTIDTKVTDYGTERHVAICSLLTFLTLSILPGGYKKSLVQKGGVECAMKILDDFKGDKELSSLACALFISLSLTEKEGINIKFYKIASLVKRLVTLVTNDEWGRDFAIRALYYFAFQRKKSQDTNKSLSHDVKNFLAAEKSIASLFDILKEDKVRETSVESAMSLLWRISTSGTSKESTEHDGLLPTSLGSVEAIIFAINRFNSTAVREAGCGILANMSMRSTFPAEVATPAFLAMQQFLLIEDNLDEGLATCALHSLCNMLGNSASRFYLLQINRQMIESAICMMKKFHMSKEVMEFGCLVIAYGSRDDPAMKHSVLAMDAFDLIMGAFEEFVTRRGANPSLEVKDASLCAIATLSGCRIGAEAVKNSGLLEILETLLAVESDMDILAVMEVIVKNTRNGMANGFPEVEQNSARQNPHMFSQLMKEENSESAVVSLFQSLMGCGQSMLEVALCRDNGFSAMLFSMAEYRNSPTMQENGCSLLAEAYYYIPFVSDSTEGPWSAEQQREALLGTITAMDCHRDNAVVQHNGCLVVLDLMSGLHEHGANTTSALPLIERCMKVILTCLQIHGTDRRVRKSGIAALGACIGIADDQILAPWTARITEELFEAILHFTGDPDIQSLALDAVVSVQCSHNGLDAIWNSLGIRALLGVIGSSSTELSSDASILLAAILKNDFMICNLVIEYPDAIEVLLSCMVANNDKVQMQISICSILETLVNFADSAVAQLMRHDGVYKLCIGIKSHPTSGDLVLETCSLLSSVFPYLDTETISSLRELVKQSILDVFEKHVEDAEVAASILDVLWICCQQDEYYKSLLLKETYIQMILSTMQLNLGSVNLQKNGCSILWILSSFGTGKEVIGSHGGIPTVVNALLAHNDSTAIQKEGLTALKNLATASCNKMRLSEAGGENTVKFSMWIHYKDPQVLSVGLSALNNIAVDSQTRSVAKMNEQIFTIVIAAMSRFPRDEQVQKNACFYLKSCSFLPANLQLMCEKGDQLIPLLFQASDNFPTQCRDRATSVVSKMQEYS